jgi:hypothetical protein
VFERITAPINLQHILIEIPATPDLQTSARGIKTKVKEISLMLNLKENDGAVKEVFNIEGGIETIKKRIKSYINERFIHLVGVRSPEDLDVNKEGTIENMIKDLEKRVNKFCNANHYPYKVHNMLIGDTELDELYYKALAKKVEAHLNANAEDVTAQRLKTRLLELGAELVPNGSAVEKLQSALIALGTIKKDISEKSFSVDADLRILAKEIAEILKR